MLYQLSYQGRSAGKGVQISNTIRVGTRAFPERLRERDELFKRLLAIMYLYIGTKASSSVVTLTSAATLSRSSSGATPVDWSVVVDPAVWAEKT